MERISAVTRGVGEEESLAFYPIERKELVQCMLFRTDVIRDCHQLSLMSIGVGSLFLGLHPPDLVWQNDPLLQRADRLLHTEQLVLVKQM